MQRLFESLIFIALATGAVAAQDATFRFASDPFSAEETNDSAQGTEKASAASAEPSSSYASYEATSSPLSLVQKKAMRRAEQRQLRLDSRKWYGFSQSRPVVHSDPYMTAYTPLWVGRNWVPNYYRNYGSIWY